MKIINGIFSSAKIFHIQKNEHALEEYAQKQIQMICDNAISEGCQIRIMPDVHPGKVGTIGLTMTVGNKLMPNLIGIDIGCGITMVQFQSKKLEYQKLDTVIRTEERMGKIIW